MPRSKELRLGLRKISDPGMEPTFEQSHRVGKESDLNENTERDTFWE